MTKTFREVADDNYAVQRAQKPPDAWRHLQGIEIISSPYVPRGKAYLLMPARSRAIVNDEDVKLPAEEFGKLAVIEIVLDESAQPSQGVREELRCLRYSR